MFLNFIITFLTCSLWLVNEDQNSGFLNFLFYFLHAWECGDESGMRIAISHLTLLCSLPRILANVEKTIFLGPPFIPFPDTHPNLEDLHLDVLSPSHGTLRRQIAASFPTTLTAQGTETWLLVEGLDERQRYEIRICWAATVSDPRESHIYQHAPVLHMMFHVMSIIHLLAGFLLTPVLSNQHPSSCKLLKSTKSSTLQISFLLLLCIQKTSNPLCLKPRPQKKTNTSLLRTRQILFLEKSNR